MKRLKSTVSVLRICVIQNKKQIVYAIVCSLLFAFFSLSTTVAIQYLINNCLSSDIMKASFMVLALGITITLSQCCMTLNNYRFDVLSDRMKKTLYCILHNRTKELSTEAYENSSTMDIVKKAKNGINGYMSVFSLVHMVVFFYLPYFIGLEIYLFRMHSSLAILVIIIFIPELVAQILKIKVFSNVEDTTVQKSRYHELLKQSITDKQFYKTTRVYQAYNFLQKKMQENMNSLGKLRIAAERKSAVFEILFKLITISGQLVAFLLIIRAVMEQKITIGAFAAVFEALLLATAYIEEIIGVHFGKISSKIGLVNNFNSFVMEETVIEPALQTTREQIVLSHVSYRYPQSESYALKDISMKIDKGEIVAVIGYNGAGKTTLSKIILGIFKPSDGTISYGESFLDKRRPLGTALFQDFQRYKLSVFDNVTISNHFTGKGNKWLHEFQIKENEFPNGYNTLLSPEYGGIDVSGGIWQRIALARSMCKESSEFIVLDEPTASIDPLEVNRLYRSIRRIAKGRTMILITHRLEAAQLSDRIIVLNQGSIIESGTHKELLQKKGLYYTMFIEQAKWYQ